MPRKIIYDTHVQLIVPDVVRAEAELRDLIKRSEALVASSEITERATSARRLTLRVRVPVERYEGFLEALTKLGRPERIKADSQDVTEEFYDLADRIKNKRLEQDTLREYLLEKKATSKLEDILTVEREIGRVREELDRLEGRLRRLDALSSLATVNIVLEQRWDQPPATKLGLGARVADAFAASIHLLRLAGEALVVVLASLVPWLVVLVPLGLILAWIVRRLGRGSSSRRPEIQVVETT